MSECYDLSASVINYAFTNVLPFWASWKCFDTIYSLIQTRMKREAAVV